MNPCAFLVICTAGWMKRNRRDVSYFIENAEADFRQEKFRSMMANEWRSNVSVWHVNPLIGSLFWCLKSASVK